MVMKLFVFINFFIRRGLHR